MKFPGVSSAYKHIKDALGIGSDGSNFKTFGTYKVQYDPSSMERQGIDGVNILDINPECRVFVCGMEVTKDVLSVSVTNQFQGNSCQITLSNPRGKYEISRRDLLGYWREDKDILAAYGYESFNRQAPITGFSPLKAAAGLIGSGAVETIKQVKGTYDQFTAKKSALEYDLKLPTIGGTTRMIYEIKHFSGITKKVGDFVFDFRDPVYVFFKGRFSSLWYFGFSGIVESFDNEDSFGDSKTIGIRCQDVSYLLKKKKYTKHATMLPAGNWETSVLNDSETQKFEIFTDPKSRFTFEQAVQAIIYGTDVLANSKLQNCGFHKDRSDIFNQQTVEILNDIFFKDYKFDSEYMISKLRNITDIKQAPAGGSPQNPGLNSYPLSPWQSIYFQYNQINLPQFTPDEISKCYDYTARFWECEHKIDKTPKKDKSGWLDSDNGISAKCFGVAGIHPGMPYDFISLFNIAPNIWRECYKRNNSVDRLTVTPIDKIRESVLGSSSEVGNTSNGSHLNIFRPRLFLLIPEKFNSNIKIGVSNFGGITLFKEDVATAFDALTSMLNGIEYKMFISPMGDMFIEPEMYDFHPIEFHPNISKTPIILKEEKINLRATAPEDSEGTKFWRQDKAFQINSDSNHPYFILEKDRMRITDTFNPENAITSVEVRGGITATGGVVEYAATGGGGDFVSAITKIINDQDSNSQWNSGWYIADGISNKLRRIANSVSKDQTSDLYKLEVEYLEALWEKILSYFSTKSIKKILLLSVEGVYNSKNNTSSLINKYSWNPELVNSTFNYVNSLKEKFGGQLSNDEVYFRAGKYVYPSYIASDIFKYIETFESPLLTSTGQAYEFITVRDITIANDGVQEQYRSSLEEGVLKILEPHILTSQNPDYKDVQTKYTVFKVKELLFDLKIRTLSDLKSLAKSGLYNPKDDIMRQYGYNPLNTKIQNLYIQQGKEANMYARVYFNKFMSKIHNYSIEMIGRPEMLLNRPYYCEAKDSIGTTDSFSISFSVGSDFVSNVSLSYIRKNSLTYSYTNDELDNVFKDINAEKSANTFFKEESDKYYKSLYKMKKIQDLTNSAAGLVGGAIVGTGLKGGGVKGALLAAAGMGAELAAKELVKKTLLVNMPDGGLYSAHDEIGHMNYDLKMKDAILKEIKSAANSSDFMKGVSQAQDIIGASGVVTVYVERIRSRQPLIEEKRAKIQENTRKLEETKLEIKKQESNKPKVSKQERPALILKIKQLNELKNNLSIEIRQLNKEIEEIKMEIYGTKGQIPKTDSDLDSFIKAGISDTKKQNKDVISSLYGRLYSAWKDTATGGEKILCTLSDPYVIRENTQTLS